MMETENNTSIRLKKYKKREISQFLAQSMIYDYASNRLDKERNEAIEKLLESDLVVQKEFIHITNGIQYLEKLSETALSEKLVEQILNQETYLNKLLDLVRFNKWPITLKWLLEATVVVLVMVATLNIIPWNKIVHLDEFKSDDYIVLNEVTHNSANENKDQNIKINEIKPEFADEEVKSINKNISGKNLPDGNILKENIKQDKAGAGKTTTNSITKNESKSPPASVKDVTQNDKDEEKSDEPNKSQGGGFLYRANFSITNVDMIAPKFKDKISEFGGQKAGEVEIGWKKSNQVYYYHFTIPQARLKELEDFLKLYSHVKLKKEPHPRIMPEGIVRVIFTIEENSPKQEAE